MKLKKKAKMMIVLSVLASLLGCGNDIPKRLSEFHCTKKIYVLKNVKNVMEF